MDFLFNGELGVATLYPKKFKSKNKQKKLNDAHVFYISKLCIFTNVIIDDKIHINFFQSTK